MNASSIVQCELSDRQDKCVYCGASPEGRKRKFCNSECRKAAYLQNDRAKGVRPRAELNAERAAASVINRDYVCCGCTQTFRPKKHGYTKYCSRHCFFAQKKARAEANAKRKKIKRNLEAILAPLRAIRETAYKGCSKKFVTNTRRKYCSSSCRPVPAYKLKRLSFKCAECGSTKAQTIRWIKFCSKRCGDRYGRRATKQRKRALLASVTVENVDPFAVFHRDGWKCQICHRRTPKRLRGTSQPRAPELDHIVPLSKGGDHSYSNTQCACRECNGKKNASVYGQLNMFPKVVYPG